MPRLIRDRGLPTEERYELKPGPNSLGRSRENDVVIPHVSLSRQHARIEVEDERVLLIDLKSRNGTFVDGLQVQQCRLKNGDRLQLGDMAFQFEDERVAERARKPGLAAELQELLAAGVSVEGESASALRIRAVTPERRAEEKLKLLLTVSQILSSPEPIDALLPKVFDLLFQIFEVDRAALLLADDAGVLEPRLTRTVGDAAAAAGPIYSQHIVDHAFQKGVAVLSGDATSDPRFRGSTSILGASIRASMCVPLKARDRIVGALYVDHLSVPDRYGQEDLEFLEAFAGQAGIAVENARLTRQLQAEAVRRSSLLRFFPPTVLGPLMESAEFGREPADCEVTVLFSDISGFTSLSSGRPPREIVALLNRYFPVMAAIVFRYEGTLEKYIGDALMAIWGVPRAHPDDADRALLAAVEMQQALAGLNAQRGDGPELAIHIGLNTGGVAFGNIGSPDYVQFAAIGDTTNVASRVCNLAHAGQIVVSSTTAARLTPGVAALEPLPPAMVKGKAEALQCYRVLLPPPGAGEDVDATRSAVIPGGASPG